MRITSWKIIFLIFTSLFLNNSYALVDTAKEESFCQEIGFKQKTAEFAECVLEFLGRIEAKKSIRFSLNVKLLPVDKNGNIQIEITASGPTSSLRVNSQEEGARTDGKYLIKRKVLSDKETTFNFIATDLNGNIDSKTINVFQQSSNSRTSQDNISSEKIKNKNKDAVAIIVGIQNYKKISKADFADNDARNFYDYAVKKLGIDEENIKLLINDEADDVEILKAFRSWLPLQAKKDKTDIYVFFSGHGLPSSDGNSLYFLPFGVDRDYLERTAINQAEIIKLIENTKPKSVTMLIDACYSGQTRSGENLIIGSRPITLKNAHISYPTNFTVVTASANDQISSSIPELRHGIFSFYLFKGMDGDADVNKDGKITFGELQSYLSVNVQKRAMTINRSQQPQLIGDSNRIFMSK